MNTEPYQTVDDVKSNGIFLCELSEGLSRMLTLPFDGQDDDPEYCWAQSFASTNILFYFGTERNALRITQRGRSGLEL